MGLVMGLDHMYYSMGVFYADPEFILSLAWLFKVGLKTRHYFKKNKNTVRAFHNLN